MSIQSPRPSGVSGCWNSIVDRKLPGRTARFAQVTELHTRREYTGREATVNVNTLRSSIRADANESQAGTTLEKLQEELGSVKIPEFTFPYPVRRNPHADHAISKALIWWDEHSLGTVLSDPQKTQTLLSSKAVDSFTHIYIDAAEEEERWVCCWNMWGFLFDELVGEMAQAQSGDAWHSLEKVALFFVEINMVVMYSYPNDRRLYNIFLQFVDLFPNEYREAILHNVDVELGNARRRPGSVYDTSRSSPFTIGFNDLWGKVVEAAHPEYAILWAYYTQRWFLGNLQEIVVRRRGDVPSASDYQATRRLSLAGQTFLVTVTHAEKLSFHQEIYDSPQMQTLMDSVSDYFSVLNDLYSFKREMMCGDVYNLVFVLSRERGCSFSDAVVLVVQILQERFQVLQRALVDFEAMSTVENEKAVFAHTQAVKDAMAGYSHFATTVGTRYEYKMAV